MADRSPLRQRRLLPVASFLALLLLPAGGGAGPSGPAIDWARHAAESTVTVVTTDEDGSRRETTVWLVVVTGEAYVRTGNTRWGDNAQSRPDAVVRIGKEEIPVRAERVQDEATLRIVEEAFRRKYGWEDRLLRALRSSKPRIFHLVPRPGAEEPLSLHAPLATEPPVSRRGASPPTAR